MNRMTDNRPLCLTDRCTSLVIHSTVRVSAGKHSSSHKFRPLALFAWITAITFCLTAQAFSQDTIKDTDAPDDSAGETDTKLPILADMVLPTAADLLQKPPVDWIVLKNDEVLVAKPVYPRPDTLLKIQQEVQDLNKLPRKSAAQIQKVKDERKRLQNLEVSLPDSVVLPDGSDEAFYHLPLDQVVKIIYHEDLILQRIGKQLDENKWREAFELLFIFRRRNPDWPGIDQIHNRMLIEEARSKMKQNKLESALAFLEDLHDREPAFAGLQDQLGQVSDKLITDAVGADDFRRARFFWGRLAACEAKHPTTVKWKNDFLRRSTTLMNQARAATSGSQHDTAVALLDEATRIWPQTRGLESAHRRAAIRYQRMTMGVLRFADEPTAYWLPTESDRREKYLTQIALFEIDSVDDAAHYRTRFFEEWEPTDLGRRAVFKLRRNRSYWESQQVTASSPIISMLQARLDPRHKGYDERLDSFVQSMTVRSPFEFTLNFSRVPLRTEALFRFPVTASEDLPAGTVPGAAVPGGANAETIPAGAVLSRRFTLHNKSAGAASYRRLIAEPDNVSVFHVGEVIEKKYESYDKAIQGLMRGEVLSLPHVPTWKISEFNADNGKRFFVRKYALPTTHVLQFNPNTKMLKNPLFRRALAYGLNRDKILKETVLRDPESKHGRIVSAPFPSSSYGYASAAIVEPREYDFTLGYSLAVVSMKQMKDRVRPLKMYCPPEPVIEAAAEKLVEQWKRIGITVNLIKQLPDTNMVASSDGRPPWDIVYRTVRMSEPIVELWPFLTIELRARVASLTYLPDWLRQEIIELDDSVDWKTAQDRLHRLHHRLQAYVQLIPLWEVDDVLVVRKTVQGIPLRPVHPYHDVERWIVQPWIPATIP